MGSSETLRSVIDAGRSSKRLDELSSARVIGKIALQVHAAEQKAGAGKAVGPVTPNHIEMLPSGEAKLVPAPSASTLGYSAPEQIAGGSGDRRSDVFSLGTVLWEALTHQRLFDAMNDAAVRAAVNDREIVAPIDINANIPVELSAICMRALARNPSDRYQSLKSMAVEIEEFLEEAGYSDDDTRIAQHLVAMKSPAKIKRASLTFGAVTSTGGSAAGSTQPGAGAAPAKSPTQPPPATLRPPTVGSQPPQSAAPGAQPTILTDKPSQPTRAKRASGADLANALATAGKPIGSTATAVGIAPAPAPEDWQDKSAPVHAPLPSVAPVVPLTSAPAITPTSKPARPEPAKPTSKPATPEPAKPTDQPAPKGRAKPPTLQPLSPAAFSTIRPDPDKATIASAVPPQVKVATATAIEAKHAEAKQPAVLVDDGAGIKPIAPIVDEPPKLDPRQTLIGTPFLAPKAPAADTKPDPYTTAVDPNPAGAQVAAKADPLATLVDPTPAGALVEPPPPPPEAADAVVEAKPEAKADSESDAKAAAVLAAGHAAVAAAADDPRTTLVADTAAVATPAENVPAAGRAPSQSEATGVAKDAKPNPVDAVSLPGRETKPDLLAGWGWGTGKHDAIAPAGYADDADDLYEQPNPKKPLMYAVGGGLAIALIITIVAFAAGGSKDKKQSTNAKSAAADRAKAEATPLPAETQPAAPEPTTDDTAKAEAAAAEAAAAEAAAAEAAKADAAQTEADKAAEAKLAKEEAAKAEAALANATKEEAARLKAEAKQAEIAKAEATKAEAAKMKADAKAARAEAAAAEAAKAELMRADAARVRTEARAKAKADAEAKAKANAEAKAEARAKAKAEADARAKTAASQPKTEPKTVAKTDPKTVAKTEPKTVAKTDPKTTKVDPKRADKATKAEPKTVAKAEPTKTEGKLDVETAYRIGLQQFARGDTSGALASLRTSLAGNPNYAPTWRGLGLVFEKMGERDQARAAYKRYLQLAPSAGDAEIIRGRLERLGT